MLKTELKSAFRRPQLYLAAGLMLLCLLGTSLPMWIDMGINQQGTGVTALNMLVVPVFFGGAILMFPFCSAMAYSSIQAEEISSGFALQSCFRSGVRKYVTTKVIAAALTGAFALGAANLVHSLFWTGIAGPFIAENDPAYGTEFFMSGFGEGTIYDILWHFPYCWPMYIYQAVGFAITGAFWSVIALWVASLMPDKMLTVTIPVVLYSLWKCDFTRKIFGFSLPDFTAFYNDGQTWQTYLVAFAFHLILAFAAVLGYSHNIRRRICRG